MNSKNQSLKVVAVAAALAGGIGFAGLAQAQAQGLYIGGAVGGSHYKGDSVGRQETDRSSTGAKIYGGYQLTPNFALETGYADLGSFKSRAGQLEADAVYLDAVGKLPLTNSVSAIGRVGVVNGKTDGLGGAGRGTNPKVGAGLEYAIDSNLSLRGEWERYRLDTNNGKANTDMYSMGVRYAF
ncbi:outer membrane beta-barrel protein [Piscinibacter sakaiensis]|uniref:outer membrane beta-barrel protein n=1 Tax=Piscinibacter sakaiensis TaxID=1547922 RepID=UPI003AB0D769